MWRSAGAIFAADPIVRADQRAIEAPVAPAKRQATKEIPLKALIDVTKAVQQCLPWESGPV
jgi:hypothetical protein